MKRITLPDFTWIREPLASKGNRLTREVVVAPFTPPPPQGPLLLAISDEYFDCQMVLRSEAGCEAGMVLYHTDATFIAVGLVGGEVVINASISGWANRWHVKRSNPSTESTLWSLRREQEGVSIGYRSESSDPVHWVGCFTLPGLANSISFGPYFANPGDREQKAIIETFSYRRHI